MGIFRLLPVAAFAATVIAGACSEELAPPEPDRETVGVASFRATLEDLVVARVELMPDTAAYERRLEEILRSHGVSREDLFAFVQAHGQNNDLMAAAYARVGARLDSLYPTGQPGAGVDTPTAGPATGDTLSSGS